MSTAPEKVEPPAVWTFGEPVSEIARLHPAQGRWTEREYLDLDTNQRVEFSDGYVEFHAMPTLLHQRIIRFLFLALNGFVTAGDLGEVLFSGVRVRIREARFREPDVVFKGIRHGSEGTTDYWDGADLVMEVVSDSAGDRHRDLVEKRREYALAGIAEYWIVDPEEGRITVLALEGTEYVEHGAFARGQRATSRLLPGFAVDVTEALAAKR